MISLEQNVFEEIKRKYTLSIIRKYNSKFAKARYYYYGEDNSINLVNVCVDVGVTLEKNLCTA